MSKKKLLFQEDDCAPADYNSFISEFKKRFGCTFAEFKQNAEFCTSEDQLYLTYKSPELNIQVEICPENPYWAVYELQK